MKLIAFHWHVSVRRLLHKCNMKKIKQNGILEIYQVEKEHTSALGELRASRLAFSYASLVSLMNEVKID